MSDTATSPCRQVCRLDDTRSFCTSCRRTLPEIATWASLAEARKREVIASIDRRSDAELMELAINQRPEK